MGMIERGRRARLAAEPIEGLRVAREILGQELQRDGAAEPVVFGLVDDTHPALAELSDDAITRDRTAQHARMREGYIGSSLRSRGTYGDCDVRSRGEYY